MMEDFDIFTNEINFTQPLYKNTINKYVYDIPSTPNGPNYQNSRKLLALESLSNNDELQGAFHLSEAVSATIRIMAIYREEQRQMAGNKLQKITSYIKPIQEIVNSHPIMKKDQHLQKPLLDKIIDNTKDIREILQKVQIDDGLPFHQRYLRFTKENNAENLIKILKELPKEWTIIQLTAPYNPNENLKTLSEYRTEIDSVYLSVFTNDYFSEGDDPFTVNIPANVTKIGEKPLFTELYSILDENYKTIDNAQFLNNKRLVQNYWNRRDDIDLRMKSVINVMDKEWLGGWGSLLTGKLEDPTLKQKVIKIVDDTISDWGFIRITKKQRVLLYNLLESSQNLTSQQTKSCIRRILTEHGNPDDVRQVLEPCGDCTKEFKLLNKLCLKCLSKYFEKIHYFSLVDGIKAFSQVATRIKDSDEWAVLKKAKRFPVILIVDEMLDTFPWENLSILQPHPATRIENIHFLYHLYKLHESDVVRGYFTTRGHDGRYVINPEKNLERMQHRMTSFVQYWCGSWRGCVAEPPPPDRFLRYLNDADLFLYCGHGDGCQFANGSGSGVESAASRAVCVLSGCGSARLQHVAARAPPTAAHRRLHLAGCPTVVGMLWEVTDLEVDKMVSTLLSLCVPSAAAPWAAVGKAKWSQGHIEPPSEPQPVSATVHEVPRAVAAARAATHYTMIASSLLVRGLPAIIT